MSGQKKRFRGTLLLIGMIVILSVSFVGDFRGNDVTRGKGLPKYTVVDISNQTAAAAAGLQNKNSLQIGYFPYATLTPVPGSTAGFAAIAGTAGSGCTRDKLLGGQCTPVSPGAGFCTVNDIRPQPSACTCTGISMTCSSGNVTNCGTWDNSFCSDLFGSICGTSGDGTYCF